MKLIPDHTGRFPERPHYEIEELEDECERIITSFLERRYGQIVIPVPTDALKVLIEGEAANSSVPTSPMRARRYTASPNSFRAASRGSASLVSFQRNPGAPIASAPRSPMNTATCTGIRRCTTVTAGPANGTSARAASCCRAAVRQTGWSGRQDTSRARC